VAAACGLDSNGRLDYQHAGMIVDTAHTAHHLGAGEPERAAQAAQIVLRGASQHAAITRAAESTTEILICGSFREHTFMHP
jgi:hypothetical protein